MALVQNVPFFSIMLSMFSGIISSMLPEKWAKALNTAMILTVGTMSACDARHLGNRGETPCVVCGPGNGPAHAINEFIGIEDYLNYVKFLALTVYRWCN